MRSGFTVSKKVGTRWPGQRRRLREVARLSMPELAVPSADHVFIARPQQAELPFEELLALVRKALGKAHGRVADARRAAERTGAGGMRLAELPARAIAGLFRLWQVTFSGLSAAKLPLYA